MEKNNILEELKHFYGVLLEEYTDENCREKEFIKGRLFGLSQAIHTIEKYTS